MSVDYVASIEALSSTGMLIDMIAAPIVLAFVGAFIAKVIFKKHFTKAKIV